MNMNKDTPDLMTKSPEYDIATMHSHIATIYKERLQLGLLIVWISQLFPWMYIAFAFYAFWHDTAIMTFLGILLCGNIYFLIQARTDVEKYRDAEIQLLRDEIKKKT